MIFIIWQQAAEKQRLEEACFNLFDVFDMFDVFDVFGVFGVFGVIDVFDVFDNRPPKGSGWKKRRACPSRPSKPNGKSNIGPCSNGPRRSKQNGRGSKRYITITFSSPLQSDFSL